MKDSNKSDYWFKRRRYGWGWIPVSWQGWVTITLYLIIVISAAMTLQDVPDGEFTKEVGMYLLILILTTATLLRISYKKGPSPKWRWGTKPSDEPDKDW